MTYEDISYALVMLKKKLIIIVLVLVFGFAAAFPLTTRIILNVKDTILPEGASVVYLSPAEVMLLKFKMALIAGVLLVLPVMLYFAYSAIKTRVNQERKDGEKIAISRSSCLLIGLIALVLFGLGAGYSYFLMMPFFIQYLYQNAAAAGVVATYSISQFISFVALITIIFGLVFEFPLIIIILVRTGIVQRDTLVNYRPHVYVGIFILAALITPPDVLSQIIIAVPLILFYELSLLLARFMK